VWETFWLVLVFWFFGKGEEFVVVLS
jgi:hypothetical protein